MSNLYRGPSKKVSYQIFIYLVKRFLGEYFLELNQSEKKIACDGNVC
jgi:hypothetical protein